jgi:hypothetical protein
MHESILCLQLRRDERRRNHALAALDSRDGVSMEKKKNDRGGLMIALVMLALLGLILALNH